MKTLKSLAPRQQGLHLHIGDMYVFVTLSGQNEGAVLRSCVLADGLRAWQRDGSPCRECDSFRVLGPAAAPS